MKKVIIFFLLCLTFGVSSQNVINLYSGRDILYSNRVDNVDSLKPSSTNLLIFLNNSFNTPTFNFSSIDSITFSTEEIAESNVVSIAFTESSVNVINPFETDGVSVAIDGTSVEVVANGGLANVVYQISGSSSETEIVFKSDVDFGVELNNAQLSLTKGSIIANKSEVKMMIDIPIGTFSQLNGATKAAINSTGAVEFMGRGKLSIASVAVDYKGIKSDSDILFYGGEVLFDVSGNQSKAVSSKASIVLDGAIIDMKLSGNAVLEEDGLGYDPSYCTGFKADGDIFINSGLLAISHTGDGGKGISGDSDLYINGGNINIETSGGGAVYQDVENATDSYTATAIKVDGEIYFNKGVVVCNSTGEAGKGISADGDIFIGVEGADNSDMQLTVSTSGARFYVSGSGEDADYANPKAIKSDANVTVNSGTITINCTQTTEGGEGLESKNIMTINGGEIYIYSAMDDAVNAKNAIVVNGGRVYAKSDGNDGTDSNGTFTMNGGLYVTVGSRAPEGGIDCDQNRFTINGGILIGTGGATSNPNAGTQHALIYNATGGDAICLKDSEGKILFCFQIPELSNNGGMGWAPPGPPPGGGPGGGSGLTVLISHPSITKSSTYTLVYGGTISGGTSFNGYATDAEYLGGTTKTVTTGTGYYTSVR